VRRLFVRLLPDRVPVRDVHVRGLHLLDLLARRLISPVASARHLRAQLHICA